jgi:cytochrome c oxidase cbb3-type subunit 3
MADKPHKDEYTGVETTGHEWDGIRELNNPLPRWWVWITLLCIVWSLGYYIFYPSWPLLNTHLKGIDNWSSRGAVLAEIAEAKAAQKVFSDKIITSSLEEIRADTDLYNFAYAGGKSNFGLFCAQCHGSGAQGAEGIANLNDDDWIWGGDIDSIHETIRVGVRSEHEDTRYNEMPAFLRDEMISEADAKDVANYVMALTGADYPVTDSAKLIYAENCAMCHGDDGEGLREMGGPRLNDAIWLYKGSYDYVMGQMIAPKHGMMPSWDVRLDTAVIKQLAIYVHSLGGGEETPE